MQELIDHGQVIRGWIGVETQPLTDDLARSFGVGKDAGVLIQGYIVEDLLRLPIFYGRYFDAHEWSKNHRRATRHEPSCRF